MDLSKQYEELLEGFPKAAKEYLEEVKTKVSVSLFDKMLTLSETEKQIIIDLICLFCMTAYQRGRNDTLELVQEVLLQYKNTVEQQKGEEVEGK